MAAALDVPSYRRLRVYAFDPSLALRMQTAPIQEITVSVPWDSDIQPGPVGEYLEVVDVDPATNVVYRPIDLNNKIVLAQDGLRPSEGNPQFHQQMVYAVAMATIGQFERALGRVALWAPHRLQKEDSPTGKLEEQFVRRLRIYPHALRDRNAYYRPAKKALLFGYFPVSRKDAFNTPGTTVFACLSHDIIAHEVTHALLDGIHPRFAENSNPDVAAFHEAFADIVALFQHFSYPAVLRDQIARTSGDLDSENLLGQLAQQFGQATGRGKALRNYVGRQPDPSALDSELEPHGRGAILVAAVFRAFLALYRCRTRDLFRIATQGTGELPSGDIHPDLSNRLAEEASHAAQTILQMCIRALDYCPPVNISFGSYLRAIVTADVNFNTESEFGRVAMIESFREWGIYPRDIRGMSIESLTWPTGAERIALAEAASGSKLISRDAVKLTREKSVDPIEQLLTSIKKVPDWDLDSDRFQIWRNMKKIRGAVHDWLVNGAGRGYADAFGIALDDSDPEKPKRTIYRRDGKPTVEVHSVRTAIRRDARGSIAKDLVIELTQRRRGYFDEAEQEKTDARSEDLDSNEDGDFKYRAGCTIVIDTTKKIFRYIITTPGTIESNAQLGRIRTFLTGDADASVNAFDGVRTQKLHEAGYGRYGAEPFALLHRHAEE